MAAPPATAPPDGHGGLVTAWLDRFFDSYYRQRPVNATFIGVHEYDAHLPDFSPAGVDATMAETQSLLHGAACLPTIGASASEALDLRLARGFLNIQQWELAGRHFHRGNPSLYTGEAVFGVMSLFLNCPGATADRVDAAIARMEAIPDFLAQGERNLDSAPGPWTERAVRECDGTLKFLTEGVAILADEAGAAAPAFLRAATTAAAGVRRFRQYLTTELKHAPSTAASCGAEALELCLRESHFAEDTADEILAYAESQLAEASAYAREHARDFGADTVDAALAQLAAIGPDQENYLRHHEELWEQVRTTAIEQDLLSWPDFPLRYVPRPTWARTAAPDLYFLFYRSPAAFARPPVHDYLVTPIEASMPAAATRALLAAHNTSVIKLNHVIHHGSIGHHVQNWHAFRASSRIGQIAAVDCAARIAMPCGGTMAEGWACYATDLMGEAGFLTPLENFAERVARIRMCARTIVDIRLHQGRIDLAKAADFYREHAGMSPAAARGEAVKNSMFPGAAVIYLLGTDGIHRLRAETAARRGSRFVLREFHDELLAYGSIPVPLIARAMKAQDEADGTDRRGDSA